MHRTGELYGQFETLDQQRETASFGMWVFLVTEVLFFGGMFMTYTLNRSTYPEVFGEASRSINLTLGAVNTVVLIGSSLTMAMSVWAAQVGKKQLVTIFLILTLILGTVFLGIKGVEYHEKFVEHHVPGLNFNFEPGADVATNAHAQLFFSLYFAMTGLHALHMIVGIGLVGWVAPLAGRTIIGSNLPDSNAAGGEIASFKRSSFFGVKTISGRRGVAASWPSRRWK